MATLCDLPQPIETLPVQAAVQNFTNPTYQNFPITVKNTIPKNKKNIHDTSTASTNISKLNVDTTFITRRYYPARIKKLPRKH